MDKLNVELLKKYREKLQNYQEYENKHLISSSKESDALTWSEELGEVLRYNKIVLNRPITYNNSLVFVKTPKEHISWISKLIKRAKKFIHIEYYAFSEGHVFNYLIQLLAIKVRSGVEVKIIVDGVGNFAKISPQMEKRLKALGIHYKVFNPLLKRKSELWWNFRDHNKILIIDNQYVLYGSCNISDEYFNITDRFFPTSEMSILLEGEIVNSFNLLFAFNWNLLSKQNREFDFLLSPRYYFPPSKKEHKELKLQLVSSSPLMDSQPIKTNLLQLIFAAKKTIRISTPYFYPPQDVVNALKIASQLGVKVQIVLPKEADLNDRVLRVHRKVLSNFLLEKIEVYEYFGFNHEKLTIVDDDIVFFGTYNWDYRSFYWNFESVLVIKNKEVGRQSNELFLKRLANSHLLDQSDLEGANKIFPNLIVGICRWCRAFA